MIRTLSALSALAMTLALAAPASASADPTTRTVSLAGKSPTQAYEAIVDAARFLCRGTMAGDIHGLYAPAECVQDIVKTTLARVDVPALSRYAQTPSAYRQIASN
jgi:hypothetical protein